jgi:enoyl-[acyl-carrier protein] reductase I
MMKGKKGIIFGVANKRSIAWGIARELLESGAEVAFAYFGERLRDGLEKLIAEYPDSNCRLYECDASNDEQVEAVAKQFEGDYGKCDFLVHSIAFADKNALSGDFYTVKRDAFLQAIDVSAYTLVSITRAFVPLLNEGASVLALSYLGGVKVVKNYNTMGVAKATLEACVRYLASDLGSQKIRVNAISAGPVNTLAARGIPGFTNMLKVHRLVAPLGENTTADEVGKAGFFLLSPMSSGMTAEIMYVDGGYSQMGLAGMEAYNL